MKFSHAKLVVISGLVWFAVGVYLLQLGLKLLFTGISDPAGLDAQSYPLIASLTPHLGSVENVALILLSIALLVGYIKGRYVLGKSAHRGVERIRSFPNPTSLSNIYSAKYYLLLALMICLGVSIKYLGVNNDIRGLVDAAIGSALINGAMIYFRLAQRTHSS
jgi:hypothetical protein